MIHVIVRERDAGAQATEPITSGSVGLQASFRFSEDWEGLGKAAVFRGSGTAVDVALTGSSCAVPHEVLQSAGGHLKIGVYGTGSQGQRVTPTIWADAGEIREGAAPSELTPTPATQSLVQQLLAAAQAARDAADAAEALAQSVRDDADAGAFDGRDATVDATLSHAGEAADAAETGEVKAMADRHDAELLAITPVSGSADYTWYVGTAWSNSGTNTTNSLSARSAKKAVSPGTVIVNASSAGVNGKTLYIHVVEWEGSAFVKRSYIRPGGFVTIGAATDTYALNFAYDSGQSAPNMDAATLADNLAVRVVSKPSGGGGTGDYSALTGKPQIEGVTLSGNKTASDLGLAKASEVPSRTSDLQNDSGFLTQHQDLSGKLDKNRGVAHAGEFCVVGSDGNITTAAMTAWSGGSY